MISTSTIFLLIITFFVTQSNVLSRKTTDLNTDEVRRRLRGKTKDTVSVIRSAKPTDFYKDTVSVIRSAKPTDFYKDTGTVIRSAKPTDFYKDTGTVIRSAKPTDFYKDTGTVIRSAKPTDFYKDTGTVIRSAKPTDFYKDTADIKRTNLRSLKQINNPSKLFDEGLLKDITSSIYTNFYTGYV